MTEDLDSIIALAFAPVLPEVRHVEVTVTCDSCGVAVDRRYPVLEADSIWLLNYHAEKSCQCGAARADGRTLTVTVTEVDPTERGRGYCLCCRQIWEIAVLESWSTGLRCRTCVAVAEDAGQDEFGDFILPEGWNIERVASGLNVAGDLAGQLVHAPGVDTRASKVSERRFRTAKGDSREILKSLADDSIDAVVTDPPAGVGIFGRDWDCFKRGRGEFVAFLVPIFEECLRVVKPGGFGAVWALPKTSHWLAWALEESGWAIVTPLYHHFSQGMPKHRSQIKPSTEMWWLVRKPTTLTYEENERQYGVGSLQIDACRIARAMDDVPGWHLTGAKGSAGFQDTDSFKIHDMTPEEIQERCGKKGRWPSDALFSHDERCIKVGTRKVKGCPAKVMQGGKDGGGYDPGSGDGSRHTVFEGYGDEAGLEEVDEFACVPSCPVRLLDSLSGYRKSGKAHILRRGKTTGKSMGYGSSSSALMEVSDATYGDEGGISRCFTTFHYSSKTAKSERNAGLFGVIPCAKCGQIGTKKHEDAETGKTQPCLLNDHSTVKSQALMRWLCRLCCPPGGQIVDPFMGSGSTGCAALQEGFKFLGIDRNERSYMIARARLAWAETQA